MWDRGARVAADERLPAWVRVATGAGTARRPAAQLERDEDSDPVGRETPAPSALPPALRETMERALGGDFSGVRIHQDDSPRAYGARAYALGSDLHFAPGEFDPDSATGQALLGHELVHVLQQAGGLVVATTTIDGAAVNDDADLELDAATRGAAAAGQGAAPTTAGGLTGAATAEPVVDTSEETDPTGPTEVGEAPDADMGSAPAGQVMQLGGKTKPTYVPFKITVTRTMTAAEFTALADQQIHGGPLTGASWTGVKDAFTPADSPVVVNVEVSLLRRDRDLANKQRGIDVDAGGGVAGARTRADQFRDLPPSQLRTQLIDEIDRRYYKARGIAPGTKIDSGKSGEADLWRMLRDEVLFQQEYLGSLPDKVTQVIKVGITGRELSPADYEQLFRISQRIEAMPLGDVADYVAKITGSTTDLDTFEKSLERFATDQAERETTTAAREANQHRLLGMESVYRTYQLYRSTLSSEAGTAAAGMSGVPVPITIPGHSASDLIRTRLLAELAPFHFTSVTDFEAAIADFQHSFEANSAQIAVDILDRFAGKLYAESKRYADKAEVATLYGKLSGYRDQFAIFEKHATIANDYRRDSEAARIPGQGHLQPKIGPDEAKAAYDTAVAAKAAAQAQLVGVAQSYPIFAEEGLPDDRKIDKIALAKTDEASLGGFLLGQVAKRQADVTEAKRLIGEDQQRIYKLDKLMPRFYSEQHIEAGSIYDLIITDKLHSDLVAKIAVGIALAVAAIALAVISFGTATPAIIAAGASALTFGISAFSAYEEYRTYVEGKGLAAVGFADDPTVVWLVIAVVAAAVDLGAAAKAISKLGPAAKALNVGGSFGEYVQVVAALKKDAVIEEKIAQAALKAGAARKAAVAAGERLTEVLAAHGGSLAKAFTDPEVYELLVQLAVARLKEGMHSSVVYVQELRKARALAKLGDLTPEEIIKAKQAWEDAVRLIRSAEEPIEITNTSGRVIGRYANGSQMEIISSSGETLHGGNVIKLDKDATTTLTGTLTDTNTIAKRGAELPGATVMGQNPGGVNILRSPKWAEIQDKFRPLKDSNPALYWRRVTDEFWEAANRPWLDEAIARGDRFRFVSDPARDTAIYVTDKAGNFVLDNGRQIKSIFGREVDYLTSKGYEFLPDGTAVRK
jgi:hypothetical protein